MTEHKTTTTATQERINLVQLDMKENDLTCTLDNNETASRADLINAVGSAMTEMSSDEKRVMLDFSYSADTAHLLLDFVTKEKQCCDFLDFSIEFYHDGLKLGVSSPTVEINQLKPMVESLFVGS